MNFTFCLFPHPWLHSGVLTARLGVLVSTLLWGAMLLAVAPDWHPAIHLDGLYPAPHRAWGIGALLVAGCQTFRTYKRSPPSVFGLTLNVVMAYLWTYVTLDRVIDLRIIPLSGMAACVAVMLFSWWNLISLPKRETWNGTKSAFVG